MKDSLMESLLLHLDAMKRLCLIAVTNLSPYMESLSNAINQRSNKIRLELWHQQLNYDAVMYLAGCLGNISLLDMGDTNISSDQCRVLKQAIQQLPSIQDFELDGGGRATGNLKKLVEWFKQYKRLTNPEPDVVDAEPDVMVAEPDVRVAEPDVVPERRSRIKCNIL
ncbi:uncharacterized protein LOC144749912 [Ciona intestinalis]